MLLGSSPDPAINAHFWHLKHDLIGLCHDYPQDFRCFVLNGMPMDCSWARPSKDYLNIYDYVRNK